MPQIMLVDDDVNYLKSLVRIFRGNSDYKIVAFDNATDALADARQNDYDVIISDLRMPVVDGVTFLSQIKDKQPTAARIILSGFCDKEALYGAINVAHADRYLEKPCSPETLKKVVSEVLVEQKLKRSAYTEGDESRQ